MSRFFNATTDFISCGNPTAYNEMTAISLVADMFPLGMGENGSGRIITKDYDATRGDGWNLMIAGTNDVGFGLGYSSTDVNVRTSSSVFSLNRWTHVAATYPGGTTAANCHIYLDCIEPSYATQTDGVGSRDTDGAEPVIIGSRKGSDRTWDGYLAHVQLFNRELTPAEVRFLRFYPGEIRLGLIGYWPLMGESSLRELDYSGFGRHGTVSGARASSINPPRFATYFPAQKRNRIARFFPRRLISLGRAAAISGTVTTAVESDIVAGGKTIIITLSGDTWIAAGALDFDLVRQDIIDGLTSAQSELLGWNNVVKALQGTAGVVRTSDAVVTITLDAQATYSITANETITVTVPDSALSGSSAIVASPTFTISNEGAFVPYPRPRGARAGMFVLAGGMQ